MTRSEVAIVAVALMGMAAAPPSGYLDYLDLPENPFVPPDPETPKRIPRESLKRTPYGEHHALADARWNRDLWIALGLANK